MIDIHNYDDIINAPRHVSKNHPQMSKENRAAQFAPFAALTGYNESIKEVSRLVDEKKILSNEEKEKISNILNYINTHIKEYIEVQLIYFIKDHKKNGGSYHTKQGYIKKIDEYNKSIKFNDDEIIKIENIYQINLI